MYNVRMACDKCGGLWPVGQVVTWHGICPVDGAVLRMTFHTTPLPPDRGETSGGMHQRPEE